LNEVKQASIEECCLNN